MYFVFLDDGFCQPKGCSSFFEMVCGISISHPRDFVRCLFGCALLSSSISSYLGCKGNQFKNKRVLMEAIHKKKGETARVKALKEQVGTQPWGLSYVDIHLPPVFFLLWHTNRCYKVLFLLSCVARCFSRVHLCLLVFRDLSFLDGIYVNAFVEYIRSMLGNTFSIPRVVCLGGWL